MQCFTRLRYTDCIRCWKPSVMSRQMGCLTFTTHKTWIDVDLAICRMFDEILIFGICIHISRMKEKKCKHRVRFLCRFIPSIFMKGYNERQAKAANKRNKKIYSKKTSSNLNNIEELWCACKTPLATYDAVINLLLL